MYRHLKVIQMLKKMVMTGLMVLCAGLMGYATHAPFDQSKIGSKQLAVVFGVNYKQNVNNTIAFYKSIDEVMPKDMDVIGGFAHYGAWDGWKAIGGLYKAGVIEVGDIVEWSYPVSATSAAEIRLVSKWNDTNPGGCYWKGGFRYESGDVVCDNSPDGPKLRRENAQWLRDHFGSN